MLPEYTPLKWCPGAVTLGHPWPSRHRCIPAQWSLSAIRGLRDTGASLHNGIEPPINWPVGYLSRRKNCDEMYITVIYIYD